MNNQKQRELVNSKEQALSYIPRSMHEFMLVNRELDILNIHVTQLTQPPQIVVLKSIFSETDIQKTVRLALGIAFHDYTQENDRLYSKEIYINGSHAFNLVGEPDFTYEFTDSSGKLHDDFIADIKVTSAYKIKKAIEQSITLSETTMENFPYSVEEFKKLFPDVFDWVYQLSCYNYIMEDRQDVYANINAINFDAGNKKIMNSLRDKSEFEILDIHPILLPLIPSYILIPDIHEKYKILKKMYLIAMERNILLEPRSYKVAQKLDELGVRCKEEDVWGGRRCSDYCNLRDICFGIENTPNARIE